VDRTFGYSTGAPIGSYIVTSKSGAVIFDGANQTSFTAVSPNLLHWPDPPCVGARCAATPQPSYAFTDRPRFTVPPWGPTPIPAGKSAAPGTEATNGFDFNNDVDGDVYIFLLGSSLDGWWSSRKELLTLTGPTPLLPDYA
jgi:hypothetical protein